MNKDVLKVVEQNGDTLQVEFKGTLDDLMNSFEAVCRAALEGVKAHCKNKGQIKTAQTDLMDRYLRVFMEVNPSGLLVLYDELTSGMLEIVSNVDDSQPKKKFLDAMMEIITKSFEKFKEDCDKNG